jgi:DNA ligase 1
MIYPTIYKKTSAGKTQIWFAEVDGDRYRTTSGQIDGKKTTTEWTVATIKNEGRSNEMTPEQQAIAEIEAEYDKKLARDYHRDLSNIGEAMRFKPMLATKWKDRKDKITARYVSVQPKLDGIRCIVTNDGMFTREGKVIYGAPHIREILNYAFEENPDLILDGELYNHAYKHDFNKIVSAVKKQTPSAQDLELSKSLIQYHVYDIPSVAIEVFEERQNEIYRALKQPHPSIVIVETTTVDVNDVEDTASMFLEDGYEGAMVRLTRLYENKRSSSLIKVKEFQDEEFSIVDIQEGVGNRAGMAARVVCQLPNGNTFGAGMIGNVEHCIDFLKNKDLYIGKQGTVVFQNYTPDGVPRFPKFKGVRFDI